MRLFGEFLVEKGLIQETHLVTAVVEQIAALPSLPEILLQSALVSQTDLLRALKHQVENKVEFKRSCMALDLWTPSIEARVHELIDQRRQPLGELLVSKGILTAEQLLSALQDYFSEKAAMDTSHEFTAVAFTAVREHAKELFPRPWAEALIQQFREISNGKVEADRTVLTQSLRRLRGAFRYVRAAQAERLSYSMECAARERDPNRLAKVGQVSEKAIASLWEFVDLSCQETPPEHDLKTKLKELDAASKQLEKLSALQGER